MTIVMLSNLKTEFSRYMRLVKQGEELEIRERGVPIAKVVAISTPSLLDSHKPLKDPKGLAHFRFKAYAGKTFDIVQLLSEERRLR